MKLRSKYARRWTEDVRFRVNLSLHGSFIWNSAYALFHLGLGIYHRSFWYCSIACYYIFLAVMRFCLSRHTRRHRPGTKIVAELKKYRSCGILFLAMNIALSLMIFFMVYWNRTFHHGEIVTIAMATYTFTDLTTSILNTVKYRKYKSPVYSASKAISLASAFVSLLTLEATMLTTFGGETVPLATRRLFLGLSGGAVSALIIVMAIYMIRRASIALKKIPEKQNERKV